MSDIQQEPEDATGNPATGNPEPLPAPGVSVAEYEAMQQRLHDLQAQVDAEAKSDEADAAAAGEEPPEEIDPLPRVQVDGVWYRRCEHDKFTMEQFDRASAVITSLGPVFGAAFAVKQDSEGNDIAGFVSQGGRVAVNANYVDWAGIGAAIEKALLQDRHALLDIAAIVYVAQDQQFNCNYPFDEHRERISGGPADMFMEGAAVFFAFYRRLTSGAGRIFSAFKAKRMR